MLSSRSARAPASRWRATLTPASAAATPAAILPKSYSGWINFSSVRVNTWFHETLRRLASGADVVRQAGGTPLPSGGGLHWMLGDGASNDRMSPCGSQFSFASDTCASIADVAAALA